MNIQSNVRLADYSTMRLGGLAKAFVTVTTKDELAEAIAWSEAHDMPMLVLGGGSNVIFRDGFDGLVILDRITGFEIIEDTSTHVTIRIGAGEDWDHIVARTVDMGLTGIEALSAIPGTAGATPVQNVGAYGQEVATAFAELEAYDLNTHQFTTLDKSACGFSYRNSNFKPLEGRHYVITSITLRLTKGNPAPPFYESLQRYLDAHHITNFTPAAIRQAVIAVRETRLPDPKKVANTGSFFKNPIISQQEFARIKTGYPEIVHWPMPNDQVKLSAGWLIEHAGLKHYANHGMKLFETNSLVFVNESAKSYQDLADFRQEVINKVHEAFGVTLEQEPELL